MQSRLSKSRIAFEKATTLDPNFECGKHATRLGPCFFWANPTRDCSGPKKPAAEPTRPEYIRGNFQLLGWCHLVTDRVDEAINLFIKARPQARGIGCFHYGLAGALALKGDLDGAKAAITESLKLKPEVNSLAKWYACLPGRARLTPTVLGAGGRDIARRPTPHRLPGKLRSSLVAKTACELPHRRAA